jgi:hypothetical protein
MNRCLTTSLLVLSLCAAGWGDRLYVRNRPFRGNLSGNPSNLSTLTTELEALVQALGFDLQQVEGNWVVRRKADDELPELTAGAGKLYVLGQEVAYQANGSSHVVNLSEFTEAAGGRLKRHPEVGTIDLDLVTQPENIAPSTLGSHHLVFYGADWAPASKMYRPVIAEFEKKHIMPVIWVDCTQPRSVNYRNYIRHFQGNLLPYTVLLSPRGKVLKNWTGYQDLGQLTTEVLKLVTGKKSTT